MRPRGGRGQGPQSALCQQPGPAARAQPADGGHGQAPGLGEYLLEQKWGPFKKPVQHIPTHQVKGLPAAVEGLSPAAVLCGGGALVRTLEPRGPGAVPSLPDRACGEQRARPSHPLCSVITSAGAAEKFSYKLDHTQGYIKKVFLKEISEFLPQVHVQPALRSGWSVAS